MDQFVRDLDDPATIERIVSDRDAGLALGVTGTPTIFINERLVELESLEQLVSEIDAALAG
jgi:protein-disulfide isomerase